jgi:hypothetical protein
LGGVAPGPAVFVAQAQERLNRDEQGEARGQACHDQQMQHGGDLDRVHTSPRPVDPQRRSALVAMRFGAQLTVWPAKVQVPGISGELVPTVSPGTSPRRQRRAAVRGVVVASQVMAMPSEAVKVTSAGCAAVGADQADGASQRRVDDAVGPAAAAVLAQHHEFVAADAAGGVSRALELLVRAGDGDQDRVADGVPVGVVDLLEPVEVDEQDGDRRGLTGEPGQRLLEPVDEQCAVSGRRGCSSRP